MTAKPPPEPVICTKDVPFAPSQSGPRPFLVLHPDAYPLKSYGFEMFCPNCGYWFTGELLS